MLAADWSTFEFDYLLDMSRLVPHLVALEAHKDAARVAALPPDWLEPPASRAWSWVEERFIPGSQPLSVSDLLTIHQMVADDSGLEAEPHGAFRTGPVRVGRPSVGGFHEGAPPEQLFVLMARYVEFIDTAPVRTLPPVITALLAHFFLDTIHPFPDGNGRTSRLAAAAVLSRGGYRLHGSYALVRHFYHHALTYHKLLQQSWQRCPFDVTAFIAFGIEGVIAELRSVEAFLRMKRYRISDSEHGALAMGRRMASRLS